jgi:hypothetical protein
LAATSAGTDVFLRAIEITAATATAEANEERDGKKRVQNAIERPS